jgi:hypothetical protein
MPKDLATKITNVIIYGIPSLVGQDLSGSVMILDPAYGDSTGEQVANFLAGPTGKILFDLGDKGPLETAQRSTPYYKSYEAISELFDNEKGQEIKTGKSTSIHVSKFELIMKALGFTPLKQTKRYEEIEKYFDTLEEIQEETGASEGQVKQEIPKKFGRRRP